ncbi:RING/FYVE/PHD zinc finger superfamily protein [Quillaja saponaria]|uniref:RING/FYVE/PHD zinc finger superfamily protein n=1 Tax=Quillaja saponaria TaxID=32244 RepID=A0AAD7P5R2_QUISA|nr:RING/FYVE/PHD zinc finger superfamily protein [Quillaja saponaria]
MGDHFVLLVDRLLTESTLAAAIESRNRLMQATSSAGDDTKVDNPFIEMDFGDVKSSGKLVECRICQDEDDDTKMETPCSCCGSLKYAHRRCVQRWCNEKGDTICEICHQQFKPGYTAPPPLFQFGRIPMSFRGNWEISRRNLNGPHVVAVVSTEQDLMEPEYDQYSASTARSLICCRSVAVIFMLLLILRHSLPLIASRNEYSFPLFMLLFLRIAGIVVPIYFMVKAVASLQRRRRQLQEPPNSPVSSSDGETEHSIFQSQPHIIRVQ